MPSENGLNEEQVAELEATIERNRRDAAFQERLQRCLERNAPALRRLATSGYVNRDDVEIQRLADEAEAGYDVDQFRLRQLTSTTADFAALLTRLAPPTVSRDEADDDGEDEADEEKPSLDDAINAVISDGLTHVQNGLDRQRANREAALRCLTESGYEETAPEKPRDLVLDLVNRADRYIDELENHAHCDRELCDYVHVKHVQMSYEVLLPQLTRWNGSGYEWLDGGDDE